MNAGQVSGSHADASPARRLGATGLAIGCGLAVGVGLVAPEVAVSAVVPYLVGLAIAVRGMSADYPHARMGACNAVTTLRMALVAGVAALGIGGGAGWLPAALASIALVLDGADGWLARRGRLVSRFGAAYDMEVDAALAACLALMVLSEGRVGAEFLVLGFSRYAFVAAAAVLPWLAAPLTPSLRRKAVCVVQIGGLVFLATPLLPDQATRPVALAVAVLVAWSFARDIRRLAAAR